MVGPTSPNGSSTAEVVSTPQQSGNSRLPRKNTPPPAARRKNARLSALKRSGEIDGMASWWCKDRSRGSDDMNDEGLRQQ
jgi:hypothetical protein